MILDTTHAIGWKANDFALQGIDGKTYSLAEVRGPKGTLVVFICNHCPYVKASISRIVAEAKALRQIGIGTIAIMPNDTENYPEDSFDNMKTFAARHGFTFPYVIDTTQEVARAYGAQCTPDFFGFNAQDELQYRGRLDASRMTPIANVRRDLFEAIEIVSFDARRPVCFGKDDNAKSCQRCAEARIVPTKVYWFGLPSGSAISALDDTGETPSHCESNKADPLAVGEGCDESIDLPLIRTLAPGVDARTCGVANPQHNLLWSRRVMDQHRCRIKGIEIPTLIDGPIDQIHGRARRADLGVARNDYATAFDRAAHRHAESWMDHCGAMFKVAADADQRRLGVGAQLCRARAEQRQRRLGEQSPELDRIVDQRL